MTIHSIVVVIFQSQTEPLGGLSGRVNIAIPTLLVEVFLLKFGSASYVLKIKATGISVM